MRFRQAYAVLKEEDRPKLEAFAQLGPSFASRYAALRRSDVHSFAVPLWERTNAELEGRFLPCPPADFLRDPVVQHMMFVTHTGSFFTERLREIKRSFPPDVVRRLLREDAVGWPVLAESTFPTSANTVHHMFHLSRSIALGGWNPLQVRCVVEWGGGYGNLAKLIRRLIPGDLTYVLIDLPLFACVQWLYLSSIFGEEAVHVMSVDDDLVRRGRINIVPVALAGHVDVAADLFISTWALSESTRAAQDLVVSRDWFGARHLLLAYQRPTRAVPFAGRLGELARASGATIEPVPHIPASSYAFR